MHSGCLEMIDSARLMINGEVIGDVKDISELEINNELFNNEEYESFIDGLIGNHEFVIELKLEASKDDILTIMYGNKNKRKQWYLIKHGNNKRIRKKNFKLYYDLKKLDNK